MSTHNPMESTSSASSANNTGLWTPNWKHLSSRIGDLPEPNGGNQQTACTAWILYGDGQGGFEVHELSTGIGNHDSRLADVNGDGWLDIVTKPYTWDTPRLDVWLNLGRPGQAITPAARGPRG